MNFLLTEYTPSVVKVLWPTKRTLCYITWQYDKLWQAHIDPYIRKFLTLNLLWQTDHCTPLGMSLLNITMQGKVALSQAFVEPFLHLSLKKKLPEWAWTKHSYMCTVNCATMCGGTSTIHLSPL